MKKAALIFGLILSLTAIGIGQVRTVTNSTLQKFQEKRLAAERDYRDNYARMGFPSPEELDRQRDTDMAARIELAEQLRQARLEKERLELERRNLDLEANALNNETLEIADGGSYPGYYIGGFGGFSSGGRFARNRHFRGARFGSGGGYRATPVGVYPNPSPRLRRFFSTGGHRGGAIIRTGRH